MDASGYHGNYLHRVVGGVELEVKFAHHNDREKVIHAGRNVGWSPVDLQVEDEEEWMSDGRWRHRYFIIKGYLVGRHHNISIQCRVIFQEGL